MPDFLFQTQTKKEKKNATLLHKSAKSEVDGQTEREREMGRVSSQITRHSKRTVERSARMVVTAVVDRVSPTRHDVYRKPCWTLDVGRVREEGGGQMCSEVNTHEKSENKRALYLIM